MADQSFTTPGLRIRPRQPKPGELLFEFVRASDHAQFRIELRDDGAYGSDVQVFRNGEMLFTQRFGLRTSAIEWATEQRHFLDGRANALSR
jgi:hypothetical protein